MHAILTLLVLASLVGASAAGLFDSSAGEPFEVVSRYGQVVEIYGHGLYATDTSFKAPIYRGTDFVALFVLAPLFGAVSWRLRARRRLTDLLSFVSVLTIVLYYAASVAFGVSYNILHLLYTTLFSASVFLMMTSFSELLSHPQLDKLRTLPPITGSTAYLVAVGVALIVAWLPDIVASWLSGEPLAWIGIYTTEITYVLDMGIISPLAIIGVVQLKRRHPLGIIIQSLIQVSCAVIGLIVIGQSVFQWRAGITIAIEQLATKVGVFVVLALISVLMQSRLIAHVKTVLTDEDSKP